MIGAEHLARKVGCSLLNRVDIVAAGVEAVTGEALRVLVGEQVALGQLHRQRAVVLAGDQLDIGTLVGQLLGDRGSYVGRHGADRVQAGVEVIEGFDPDRLDRFLSAA